MPNFSFIWDLDDERDGNVDKLAQHGLTPDDVIFAVLNSDDLKKSKSTGRPAIWGETPDGRQILVVYEIVGRDLIYVITAYEPSSN